MTDEATIRDMLERRYPTSLNTGDIDAYVDLYGDDVLWGVPNVPDATSREQIGARLRTMLSTISQTVEVTVDDVVVDGDLAVATALATGTAARKPDGDPKPLALRVLWALKRDDGRWSIIRQVGTPKPTG
jgi:uncharacterized protein (TIGR02246 family)